MNVDVITISRIEHSISNTTISTLAIIAKALNVTPDQLLNS
ncbi:helix-turn-helix domain-containing protein [Pedobacter sp. AW31-3R]